MLVYKLNSDSYSRGNPGLSGGGGLLHDSKGAFVFSLSYYFGSLTSLHAELKALVFGVQLCLAQGYTELHIEADSLVLVQMMQGCCACLWRLQRDLDALLQYQSHFRAVMHCFREANKSADRLTNTGVDLARDCMFNTTAWCGAG